MKSAVFFTLLIMSFNLFGMDTLCTHPNYPPITYKTGEYNYYKYTAKYIPESLMHAFKILATCGDEVLIRFIEKSEDEVVEEGMFQKGFRMRKEFCLEGYSYFTQFFHDRHIYYPYSMKTYILLSFHQYLKGEKIKWSSNKKIALNERKDLNRAWKKRMKTVFKPIVLEEEPAKIKDPVFLEAEENEFFSY